MRKSIYMLMLLAAVFFISLLVSGCKKILDKKSNQVLTVPSKVQDLQMLLDEWYAVNQRNPSSGVSSADEFYLKETQWAALEQFDRDTYTWQPSNLFRAGENNDWGRPYALVNRVNTVLHYLNEIPRNGIDAAWNNTKGHALFLRAKTFLDLASIFSLAYDSATAASDLGIVLRLDPDFNKASVRASVQQTYERILQDLKDAAQLLPVTSLHPLKPGKAAAYGMLARTYLYMRRYNHAYLYADSALRITSTLMNYNTPVPGYFNPAASFPFAQFNPEVIFSSSMVYPQPVYHGYVDSTLYNSYHDNDLRKTLFHTTGQVQNFKGCYEGIGNLFDGVATDEMFLIRAESAARKGFRTEAMNDLNQLLQNRFKTGTFAPLTAATDTEALALILNERRKELVFRGMRFMDIKRLNKEGSIITLTRKLGNNTFTLPPNDLRYALPLPKDVIALTGMPDNPR
jgi:tetratricopeptide (TPR) repeat protein